MKLYTQNNSKPQYLHHILTLMEQSKMQEPSIKYFLNIYLNFSIEENLHPSFVHKTQILVHLLFESETSLIISNTYKHQSIKTGNLTCGG